MDIQMDSLAKVQAAGVTAFKDYCILRKDMPGLLKQLKQEKYWRSVTASGHANQHESRDLAEEVVQNMNVKGLGLLTVVVHPDRDITLQGAETIDGAYRAMSTLFDPNKVWVVRMMDILCELPKSVEVDL